MPAFQGPGSGVGGPGRRMPARYGASAVSTLGRGGFSVHQRYVPNCHHSIPVARWCGSSNVIDSADAEATVQTTAASDQGDGEAGEQRGPEGLHGGMSRSHGRAAGDRKNCAARGAGPLSVTHSPLRGARGPGLCWGMVRWCALLLAVALGACGDGGMPDVVDLPGGAKRVTLTASGGETRGEGWNLATGRMTPGPDDADFYLSAIDGRVVVPDRRTWAASAGSSPTPARPRLRASRMCRATSPVAPGASSHYGANVPAR